MPPPRGFGRRRRWPMREVVNAIFYALRCGCPWRMLPAGFPPPLTVYRWFCAVARRRLVGIAQPRACRGRPRTRRARSEPVGGGVRQLERQDERGGRTSGLRRGQEGEWPQAPRAGRHRRTRVDAACTPSIGPGPRRGRTATQGFARPLAIRGEGLRRGRVPGGGVAYVEVAIDDLR